jgi:hypothetical protein
MTPLELRAIAYAVTAFIFVGLGVWIGAYHVQAKWNIDKLAQDKALQEQQAAVIALTLERDQLKTQVSKDHEQIIATGTGLVVGVSDSLHRLETALHSRTVPGAVVNTTGVQNAVTSAGIDPELATAIGRVNEAITSLAGACIHVDADRTAIIALEPKPPEHTK